MQIIIETPAGSKVKFKYNEDTGIYSMHKRLMSGLAFPYDFGFIPGTRGEDGDPLDVLVLSEFQSYPGIMIDCRIIGCIMVRQGYPNRLQRNDRYIAVPFISEQYHLINTLPDLGEKFITETRQFFKTYVEAGGKEIQFTGDLDRAAAEQLLADSI